MSLKLSRSLTIQLRIDNSVSDVLCDKCNSRVEVKQKCHILITVTDIRGDCQNKLFVSKILKCFFNVQVIELRREKKYIPKIS